VSDASEITDETRRILRRVGLALAAFGLLDIGLMIYCIANRINYSSSFNLFAVISGIYLYRGHPWYVKWVTRAAGFYAAAFCAMVPIAPFFFPADLGVLELRLHPVAVIGGAAATAGVIAFLWWVYRELRQEPVLADYAASGADRRTWVAPLWGVALAVAIATLMFAVMHGDAEQNAIALAQAKTGPGYHYFVAHLSYAGDHGRAEVLAYDERAVRTEEVEW
jgi:hypothetical protein